MIKVSCPICQRLMEGESLKDWPEFPFCSKRCKLIDLGRWLGEAYHVPADEPPSSWRPEDQDTP